MALENQRYGRNKETLIDHSYIESGEYRRKYDNATDDPKVNKALYDCAKKALKHRSGTVLEDMYWIDGETGAIIHAVTDSTVNRAIICTDTIKRALKNAENIIAIHTHPGSMPPSVSDLNACFRRGYVMGFVACHNGKVFGYSVQEEINERIYNMYIMQFVGQGYDEFNAQLCALEKLSNAYRFHTWEVKSDE